MTITFLKQTAQSNIVAYIIRNLKELQIKNKGVYS